MPDEVTKVLQDAGVKVDSPPPPPPQAIDLESIKSEFQKQIQDLQTKLESNSKSVQQKDELLAKAMGYLEGSGVAKFDQQTNSFVPTKTDGQQDEVVLMQSQIREEEKALKDRKAAGEIDSVEYAELYQDIIMPMKERLSDAKMRKTINETQTAIESRVRNEMQQNLTRQQQNYTVEQKFAQVANEFPDVNNVGSELFQEMNAIYTNPVYSSIFSKANPTLPDKDPNQYRALAEMAATNLQLKGKAVNRYQTNAMRSDFYSPSGEGYKSESGVRVYMDARDVQMMQNQGIRDPKILKDIVDSIGSIDPMNIEGSHLVMEMPD